MLSKDFINTILLFFGWYIANFLCNTTSKASLVNNSAIILTFVQMLVGGIGCFIVIWNKNPEHNGPNFTITMFHNYNTMKSLFPLVAVHVIGNLCTNFGILYGSIPFVQIIKAMEPMFTMIWGVFILQEYPPPIKVISSLPIVAGVILVSHKESKISYSLFFSMLSNIAFSFRNVASKRAMEMPIFQDPTTLFYCINLVGSMILLFPCIILEQENFVIFGNINLWGSGLFHFLYNWCSFLLLNKLHVLSHALANVMKRAFIIILGIILYNAEVNLTTTVGISFCIGGSLLYNYTGNIVKHKKEISSILKLLIYLFSLASIVFVFVTFTPAHFYKNLKRNTS